MDRRCLQLFARWEFNRPEALLTVTGAGRGMAGLFGPDQGELPPPAAFDLPAYKNKLYSNNI